MLAHVINSLLCLPQLCHGLLHVELFFRDCFCLAVQLAECVVAPCCEVVPFFIVFELREHINVRVNIMSSVLLLIIYLPPSFKKCIIYWNVGIKDDM